MLFSSLIPTRWRRTQDHPSSDKPGIYNRQITPYLSAISQHACTHPVYTIACVFVVGSAFYANLLESGFFQPSAAATRLDFAALAASSRRLHLGPETAWKWQLEENVRGAAAKKADRDRDAAVVTLAFPNTVEDVSSYVDTLAQRIPVVAQSAVEQLPSSNPKSLGSISSDSSVAFSMPYSDASDFLYSITEIPAGYPAAVAAASAEESDDEREEAKWIMRDGSKADHSYGIFAWASNSWTAFLDLIRNAETLDIVIMSLGYLAMYLTFVSLFVSMRRMGSNFWLATSTLFSSAFAFLFGLVVTLKLGVPENVVLLSEGVPFLVVTVGFEKPIMLTQAVLSASIQARTNGNVHGNGDSPLPIQHAVQIAVRERGFEIVRDYAIEILILCAGAASGIQGGLRQFCFLAAWTLFFDCILLFTFYTSILTIKLEINRIKRHVALRKALEEDGVSRRVAENVAMSNEWPKDDNCSPSRETSLFGRKIRDSSIPRFKVMMVTGFILINLLHLCSMPFRGTRHHSPVTTAGLSSVVTQPPMDPFKVAGNGLDHLFALARKDQQPLSVTVFSPIKYEYYDPTAQASAPSDTERTIWRGNYKDGVFTAMGGRVVEGLLKSFEDPVLSKWLIILLAMSLVLNGYLFNAARWSIKDPEQDKTATIENGRPRERARTRSPVANGHAIAPGPRKESQELQSAGDLPRSEDGESRVRSRQECEELLKEKKAHLLDDAELIELSLRGKIPGYALEKTLGDKTRAVKVRRAVVAGTPATSELSQKLERSKLPYEHFDYERVHGACCENVIGYMPLPLGVAGPLVIDGKSYFIPMATTEGVLVASTSRGCKAINAGGGAITVLTGDGMTRGPCVGFETLTRAAAAKIWLDSPEGQKTMRDAFNSTSRFARLQAMKSTIAGTYVYIRFKTTTGDAMGMNMISKGVEHALGVMSREAGFADMAIITVSGNYCTDKKPAAINWIDGRGKSVVAEAIIPADVVRGVLKSDVDALVELNVSKNLIGSAMAGSIGGFNAHASNIVTALYLATGQDPAQNVESSNCITVMKNLNGNLQISVSMPSIEVGTIGGGTVLEPQAAMLDLLGVRGPHPTSPGANARGLARIVAAAVLAGELSLCSALAAGHLVQAHMSHNRSAAPSRAQSPRPGGKSAPSKSSPSAGLSPPGLAMTGIVDERTGRSRA